MITNDNNNVCIEYIILIRCSSEVSINRNPLPVYSERASKKKHRCTHAQEKELSSFEIRTMNVLFITCYRRVS